MKPTLIIVDDVKAVREELAGLLAEEFEVVAQSASAAEAIEACRIHQPQLVVMDVVMPHMSGIEATRAILEASANSPTSAPKVIILSGLTDESVVMQALEAGACEYLFKPVDGEKLKEVLRHFVLADELAPIAEIQNTTQDP